MWWYQQLQYIEIRINYIPPVVPRAMDGAGNFALLAKLIASTQT
jgi:hypothetical protein